MAATSTDESLEALLDFIRRNRGFDFTAYKRPSLTRRIRRRMETVGIDGYDEYLDLLAANADEFAPLFDTILINVTSFFRDAAAWDYLASDIVPRLLEGKADGEPVRVWSVGCATGEEAYPAAIVLGEAMGLDDYRERVKIYATDVDEAALADGRHGVYGAKDVS